MRPRWPLLAAVALALASPPAFPGDEPAQAAPPAPPSVAPPAKTSDEALALIREAAKRQGTAEFVGAKAVRRIQIHHGPNRTMLEALDLERDRYAYTFSNSGDVAAFGCAGREYWCFRMWEGLQDISGDAAQVDLRLEMDARSRDLRVTTICMFLGGLVEGPPVTLAADEALLVPQEEEEKPLAVQCRRLDRAASERDPEVSIFLHAETLRLVAARFASAVPGKPPVLLIFRFPGPDRTEPILKGIDAPNATRAYEVGTQPDAPPLPRRSNLEMQFAWGPGGRQFVWYGLAVDPEKLPPSDFEPPKSDAATLALIREAAAKQGTEGLTGERAVQRMLVFFTHVTVVDGRSNEAEGDITEAIALPEDLYIGIESFVDRTVRLGKSRRSYWVQSEKEGRRILGDRAGRDKQDFEEIDGRRRMLRMAARVFFLGGLVEGPVVTLQKDETLVIPNGSGAPATKVACRHLDRAGSKDEPRVSIFLDAKSLRPVAARFPSADPAKPALLLTFSFYEKHHGKQVFPPGLNHVPDWVELYELPPEAAEKPGASVLKMSGEVTRLFIDPAQIPDSSFDPPPPTPPK